VLPMWGIPVGDGAIRTLIVLTFLEFYQIHGLYSIEMDLTSLSLSFRKAIVYVFVGLVALIILYIVFRLLLGFISNLRPEAPPEANRLFGTLTPIKFENPYTDSSKFTYSLETVDSQLPVSPVLFNVYQLKQPTTLFQGLEQAKRRANEFKFEEEPTSLSSSLYQFKDSDRAGYTFSLDVVSGNFRLILDPSSRPDLLTGRLNFDSNEAISKARNYLSGKNALPAAFTQGEARVQFLNITPRQTTSVTSPDQANAYRVDFYPASLDNTYRILSQRPDTSILNITLLANGKTDDGVYEINYQQFEIDAENVGTYNIKDTSDAWAQLQSGQGVVLRVPKLNSQIAINAITFGYFLEQNSKHLKPIYIFEGTSSVDQITPDFLAVLPAIAVENEAE
jgi:hypothetical protein